MREIASSRWCGVLVGVWVSAALVTACGDPEESATNDAAGNKSTGGEVTSGGSASGNGGVAPGGGSGGNGAVGGDSSPAGACQRAPDRSPTIPQPSELDADLVARAAAVVGSCMPDDGVARNAAHIWLAHLTAPRTYYRHAAQLDCLANAACGCAAIEQCLGWVYSAPPDPCTSECDGEVFKGCGDGVQVSIDCSLYALSCDPEAMCVPAAPVACEDSVRPTCDDAGDVSFCDDDFMRTGPCASLGYTCTDGKCTGEGAACTALGSGFDGEVSFAGSACSGNTLTACLGGRTTSVDCAEQGPGFSCQARDGAFFCGLAAECLPADNYASEEPATCDGSELTFCNAGRLEHIDCLSLGFTGCEVDTSQARYGCVPGVDLAIE